MESTAKSLEAPGSGARQGVRAFAGQSEVRQRSVVESRNSTADAVPRVFLQTRYMPSADRPTIERVRFEWHRAKAEENLRKHDVSFNEAVTVFYDRLSAPSTMKNTPLTRLG